MRAALVLLLSSSSLVFASLHTEFSHILNGSQPLDATTLDSMYSSFKNEYPSLISATHYPTSNVNRKAIFETKVRDIAQHNANPNLAWKKGLNEYSDLTDEEFNSYFNFDAVQAGQECSATKRPAASAEPHKILQGVATAWNWRDFGVVTPVKN